MMRQIAFAIIACSGLTLLTFADDHSGAEHPFVRRVESIPVSAFSFKDASPSEILEFVRIKIRDWDPEPEPTRKGFSVLQFALDDSRRVSYSTTKTSLASLFRDLATSLHIDIHITEVGVVITPAGKPPFPNGKSEKGAILKSYHPAKLKPQPPRDG